MKKIFIIGIVLLLSIGLIGCSEEASQTSKKHRVAEDEVVDKGDDTLNQKRNTSTQNSTNKIEKEELTPLPKKIKLPFKLLEMNEIQTGKPDSSWEYIKTIPLDNKNGNNLALDIYDVSKDKISPFQYNGILRFKKINYLIKGLSNLIFKNEDSTIKVFQRLFPGQDRYKLLGSLELSANGFGRKLFVVYDLKDKSLKSFEEWGEPVFYDLDNDGIDEFIIEFQGLHMHFPDITIIKVEDDDLEICSSVVNTVRRNQGDLAKLLKNENPPTISITNAEEQEPSFIYKYQNGILTLIDIRSFKSLK